MEAFIYTQIIPFENQMSVIEDYDKDYDKIERKW